MGNLRIHNVIDSPAIFVGYEVIPDPMLTESLHETIKRNWLGRIAERLFKLPKRRIRVVPSTIVYIAAGKLFVNPDYVSAVNEALHDEYIRNRKDYSHIKYRTPLDSPLSRRK